MNKMYLVIGDWSDDGHGKFEKVLVEVNKTVEEVQNAYKDSVNLTKISFNENNSYHGFKDVKYEVCIGYEDNRLIPAVIERFKELKCPTNILENFIEESYVDTFYSLWFWFVSLSLPDLKYNVVNEIPNINGYWNKNLNVGFGYGLYM